MRRSSSRRAAPAAAGGVFLNPLTDGSTSESQYLCLLN